MIAVGQEINTTVRWSAIAVTHVEYPRGCYPLVWINRFSLCGHNWFHLSRIWSICAFDQALCASGQLRKPYTKPNLT